jgi:hypothetical protein
MLGHMLETGSAQMDAERAFKRAARLRRRAALARRLRREPAECGRLTVYDDRALSQRARPGGRIREIPLSAIHGTAEPGRAAIFDGAFRPAPAARTRWMRIWLAERRGVALPPVTVVPVQDGYALLDGHHRVSVAAARGAITIDGAVETSLG